VELGFGLVFGTVGAILLALELLIG